VKLRDARIAKAVIAGEKIAAIAAREGVSERQVYRRIATPEVRGAVDAAGRALTRAATLRIQRGAATAADALCAMADGTVTAVPGRVTAAAKVIDTALRAVEIDDLMTRLSALEQIVTERIRGSGEGSSS